MGEPRRDLRGHIPALDGLRGVAVLLVLLFHFTHLDVPAGRAERAVIEATRAGWSGVDLFFVLSGFLITGILLDGRGERGYFRNFYARRALRIFPLYYAYLAVLFFVLPRLAPGAALDAPASTQAFMWSYLANVFFAIRGGFHASPHVAHFWSLAVEEQFYLVWPLVVFALPRRAVAWACALLVAAGAACRLGVLLATWNATAGYVLTPCRMDALAAGGLVAAVGRSEGGLARLARWAPRVLVVSSAAIAAVWIWRGTFFAGDTAVQATAFSPVAAFYAALLVLAVTAGPASGLERALTRRWLRAFGRHSYGIYVLHYPLFRLAEARGLSASAIPPLCGSRLPGLLAFVAGASAASYLAAVASWHLLEKRFLALKAHFPRDAAEAPRVAAVAPARRACG